jgi:hypothetical protein
MTKSRYRYKRYLLYLPKSIGDAVDTKMEYVARLFGPAIVLLPKRLENFFSRLEDLEKAAGKDTANGRSASTGSLVEDSRTRHEND